MKNFKADIFFIFVLLIVSIWALKSLFGGAYYTSQDGIHQIARLYHFKLALKDGVFPPRWANQAMYGFGYPLFEFNYHLPWYAAMPLIFLRVDLFDIIKILHFAAYFFSGVFMYFFLRELVKKQWVVAAGTILFLISPYRFLNIYVRNAMGEVFAFMFFPLVFYALLKLARAPKAWHVVLLSISLYGIILSHALSFVIFLPSILIFAAYCLLITQNKKHFVVRGTAAFLLFLSLSAYYLFPAYLEKSYTIFDSKFQQIYGGELLDIKKVIYTPWGYAGNGNPADTVMSFQFGIANWAAALSGLIAVLYFVIKRKIKENLLIVISSLTILFSISLTMKQSLPFWDMMAKIFAIDFPWKLVGIAVLWSGILLSLVLNKIKNPAKYFILIVILGLAFYANRNHIRVNKYVSFDIPMAVFFEKSTNTEDEYLPQRVNGFNFGDDKNMTIKLIDRVETDKKGKVSRVVDKNQEFSFNYVGPEANATVKKIYFPGWSVMTNDNHKINFTFENGFFNFKLPKGNSNIKIMYEGTLLVRTSTLLSVFAWGLTLAYFLSLIGTYVKNKSKKNNQK